MAKQIRQYGHPVFNWCGDLFKLSFPRDYLLHEYLRRRLKILPNIISPSIFWREIKSRKSWHGYANIDPSLDQYTTGLDYLRSTKELSDLTSYIDEPFLVRRDVCHSNSTGCFLFSSEHVQLNNDGKYGVRRKLIEVRDKFDMPVLNEAGHQSWRFRPMLIPLKRNGDVDTIQFQRSNPDGTEIQGGIFTLGGKDVRLWDGPLTMTAMQDFQLEDGDGKDDLTWLVWGGCMIANESICEAYPEVLLEYLGRP